MLMKLMTGAVLASLTLGTPAAPVEIANGASSRGPSSCSLEVPVDATLMVGSDFDLIDDERPADLTGKFMTGTGEKGDIVCVQTGRDTVLALKVRPHGTTKARHLAWGTVLFWVERDGHRSNRAAVSLDCWDPACVG